MIENQEQEMAFDSSDTETSNNQNYDKNTVIGEENHQTSIVKSSNV